MDNNSRKKSGLARAVSRLPVPRDYFSGVRRWRGAFPDNILLFSRVRGDALDPTHESTHFHHRWVLLMSFAGEGTILRDRVPMRLRPGHALLIPPMHLHHYTEVTARRLSWLFVTFDWPGQTAATAGALGVSKISVSAQVHLERLLRLWRDQGHGAGTMVSAEVMVLLLALFPALDGPGQTARAEAEDDTEDDLVALIRRQLMAARQGRIPIEELAGKLSISPSHLRATFRAKTGLSLGRYLREWRIREAALLLRSENLSVKETAERLGFQDIYAFSHAFRRALGVSPSSLRVR